MLSKSRRLCAAAAVLITPAAAHAAIRDTVTFPDFTAPQTTDFSAGVQFQRTLPATGYTTGQLTFTGMIREINGTANDFVSDNAVRITTPNGGVYTRPLSLVSGYSGNASFTTTFALPGIYGTPAGSPTPWTFTFINTRDDSPVGQPDATISNLSFSITDDSIALPPPPKATDLGDITAAANPPAGPATLSRSHAGGALQWYRFILPNRVSKDTATFLTLDTTGSSLDNGPDTVIALYDEFGTRVGLNDDNGTDLLSNLTFGQGGAADLNPGIYFLGVAAAYAEFSPSNFTAWTSGAEVTGQVAVNLTTNATARPLPEPAAALSFAPLLLLISRLPRRA